MHIAPNKRCLGDAKLMTYSKTYKHAKRISFIYIPKKSAIDSFSHLGLPNKRKTSLHLSEKEIEFKLAYLQGMKKTQKPTKVKD